MSAAARFRVPTRHWTLPGIRLSCPSCFEVTNALPIAFGASQSPGERAHNQAHMAYAFVGSCSATDPCAHPHDQTDAIPVSAATCCAASASHFPTSDPPHRRPTPLAPPTHL